MLAAPNPPPLPDAYHGGPVKPSWAYTAIIPARYYNGQIVPGLFWRCRYPIHGKRRCVLFHR